MEWTGEGDPTGSSARERPVLLLTGERAAGKSTICLRVAEMARAAGVPVAGIVSRGIYRGGERIGLEAVDLAAGDSWRLASTIEQLGGPVIGAYSFSPEGLARAIRALEQALERHAGLLVADEIGPLELARHGGFYPFLVRLKKQRSRPDLLIVIRPSLVDDLQRFLGRGPFRVFGATGGTRESLPRSLLEAVVAG